MSTVERWDTFVRVERGFDAKSPGVLGIHTRVRQMNLLVQLELCEHVSRTGGTSVLLITVQLSFRVVFPQLGVLSSPTLTWHLIVHDVSTSCQFVATYKSKCSYVRVCPNKVNDIVTRNGTTHITDAFLKSRSAVFVSQSLQRSRRLDNL
jgi:hypothetical protein